MNMTRWMSPVYFARTQREDLSFDDAPLPWIRWKQFYRRGLVCLRVRTMAASVRRIKEKTFKLIEARERINKLMESL